MDGWDFDVIAPNLKRRLSGVTATIVRLVPVQAKQISIVATGPGLPPELPNIPLWKLLFLPRNRWRVWHARRNVEMLLGIVLRGIVQRRLRLLFTSASQRDHSRYTRWLISKMDGVVATSKKTAKYLERPADVVMHGIDLNDFKVPADRAIVAKNLGLPDGFLIGCYGRIRHQKGTDIFVDAMIELLPKHPDVIGVVMGLATGKHTKFLDGLRTKISTAGLESRLLILPEVPVDEMAKWYQALGLFVAPQRSEGFGLTPLEAAACGVPTIASRVGAFEELIVDHKTGRLVDTGNLQMMTRTIDEAVADRAWLRSAGTAAHQHVSDGFSIEQEATALVRIYQNLLHGGDK